MIDIKIKTFTLEPFVIQYFCLSKEMTELYKMLNEFTVGKVTKVFLIVHSCVNMLNRPTVNCKQNISERVSATPLLNIYRL